MDKIFEDYDTNRNGSLDKYEVRKLLSATMGEEGLSERNVQEFMSKMDVDGNQKIEKDELFRLYKKIYC